ncbi:MAG: aminotransferase class V-fold PLP-dependent enzyme [Litorimonas sp.]
MSGENWAEWMDDMDAFRSSLARILRVKKESICPQVNVSSALTKILFSLPKVEGRDVILLSKMDFPTIGFVAKQAEGLGYRLKFIDGDPSDIQLWNDAITNQVAFVLATHALSNTSHVLPVSEICKTAKAAGVISIVDVAQSLGAVPVDLDLWDADFVIGTGVKFLCFGPGACFLYAAERMLPKCRPLDVGWFSHENPFEMDIEHFCYSSDAMRFFGGTPSPAPYILANAAMMLWKTTGLQVAQNRIQAHLSVLHDHLPDGVAVSPVDETKRGATLVVASAFGDQIHEDLLAGKIMFDQRKQGYRFSVHGYTSANEIGHLAKIFSKLKR